MALRALPFAVSLSFAALLTLGMIWGGVWIAAMLVYAFIATPLIDQLTTRNTESLDPTLEESALFWHRAVVILWVPVQLGMLVAFLTVVGRTDNLSAWEAWLGAVALGVAAGGIGITYAHELIHQRNRFEPMLGEILLCSSLYGHFRIEHVFGHHSRVGTPQDPATARQGESFYAFWTRTVAGGFRSAWAIQKAQLARRGESVWSVRNAFWRYAAWAVFWFALAFTLAGWLGVGLFALQAFVAVTLLEMVNYVEHYGLQRREIAPGRYEPCQPRHSWNANHRFSNFLLINLQRHSDHHFKPDRRYPLLQGYGEDEAPQLPLGYAAMVLLTLAPPIWFRVMDPRVEAWRRRFHAQDAQRPSA